MKRCTRCRKNYDDIEFNFFRDSRTEDGFSTRCKRCKAYGESPIKRARRDKRRYEKLKQHSIAREHARAYYQDFKGIYECAVLGCRKKAEELHHVDYVKLLEVIPLCKNHHAKNHSVCS